MQRGGLPPPRDVMTCTAALHNWPALNLPVGQYFDCSLDIVFGSCWRASWQAEKGLEKTRPPSVGEVWLTQDGAGLPACYVPVTTAPHYSHSTADCLPVWASAGTSSCSCGDNSSVSTLCTTLTSTAST